MFFDTVRFHQVWSEFNCDDNHFTIDNHVERYTDIKWPFDFFWKVTVKCNLVETKSNILYRYVDKYLNNFDLSSPYDICSKIAVNISQNFPLSPFVVSKEFIFSNFKLNTIVTDNLTFSSISGR